MSTPVQATPSLQATLAPLLKQAPGTWQVVDTGTGAGTASRVWPDETADALIVINQHTALFRREASNGTEVGTPIEGTAAEVVDAVCNLPPPLASGMVVDGDNAVNRPAKASTQQAGTVSATKPGANRADRVARHVRAIPEAAGGLMEIGESGAS